MQAKKVNSMGSSSRFDNSCLEVYASRWMAGAALFGSLLMTCLSLGFLGIVLPWVSLQPHALTSNSNTNLQMISGIFVVFGSMGIFGIWSTIGFMRLFGRKTPLFRFDEEGITDYGLLTSGYGLIKWQDIQSVAELSQRGTWLLLKVNNFDELLKRRNILGRPILAAFGAFYGIFGGQIYLPLPYGKTDASEVKMALAKRGYYDIQDRSVLLVVFSIFLGFLVVLPLIILRMHAHHP
jgi:hypothetical protein